MKQLRQLLAHMFFYGSLICLAISRVLDLKVGAMGMEAIRFGPQRVDEVGEPSNSSTSETNN